jgi:CAAX prenyl protease-like protein
MNRVFGIRCGDSASRTLPFAMYIGFLALATALAEVAPEFDGRWLYPVKATVVALALALLWRQYAELRETRRGHGGFLAALGVGAVVFVLWVNLDMPWATLAGAGAGPGFDPRDGDGGVLWSLIVPRLLGAAVVVPVMEELFWRSLVMRWIESPRFLTVAPATVGLRGLALSSLAFGLEHELWFAGILAGLAYGWLYKKFDSLWVPILAHATTNLLLGIWVILTGHWRFW